MNSKSWTGTRDYATKNNKNHGLFAFERQIMRMVDEGHSIGIKYNSIKNGNINNYKIK